MHENNKNIKYDCFNHYRIPFSQNAFFQENNAINVHENNKKHKIRLFSTIKEYHFIKMCFFQENNANKLNMQENLYQYKHTLHFHSYTLTVFKLQVYVICILNKTNLFSLDFSTIVLIN